MKRCPTCLYGPPTPMIAFMGQRSYAVWECSNRPPQFCDACGCAEVVECRWSSEPYAPGSVLHYLSSAERERRLNVGKTPCPGGCKTWTSGEEEPNHCGLVWSALAAERPMWEDAMQCPETPSIMWRASDSYRCASCDDFCDGQPPYAGLSVVRAVELGLCFPCFQVDETVARGNP